MKRRNLHAFRVKFATRLMEMKILSENLLTHSTQAMLSDFYSMYYCDHEKTREG